LCEVIPASGHVTWNDHGWRNIPFTEQHLAKLLMPAR